MERNLQATIVGSFKDKITWILVLSSEEILFSYKQPTKEDGENQTPQFVPVCWNTDKSLEHLHFSLASLSQLIAQTYL